MFLKKNEFEGLATSYDQYRPDYPEILFEEIKKNISTYLPDSDQNALCLDIGAGTGISTRMLRRYVDISIPIVGIEPGKDMLSQAIKQSKDFENICYINGTSEDICFNDQTVDLILAAQALQWFNRKVFYLEVKRVLKTNGILAVIQNNRHWEESPFLSDYEAFLEKYGDEYSRHYRSFDIAHELTQAHDLLFVGRHVTNWQRKVSKQEFAGMANSSTKYNKAQQKHGADYIDTKLFELIDYHFTNTKIIDVKYRSELFLAVKVRKL